jgi:two-component system, chemotaxis family, response regulator Rcp1
MELFVLSRPKEILVVEDSVTDTKMVLWALDKNKHGKSVVTLIDGDQAMAYLRKREDGFEPDLILLDLNLPRKDGWQVLAECKADPLLKGIPIVVFSTSQAESDIKRCYELGANSFISKPFDLDEFQRAIALIENYWLGLSVPMRFFPARETPGREAPSGTEASPEGGDGENHEFGTGIRKKG